MGWASGSHLMNKLIDATKKHVPEVKVREKLYRAFIKALDDQDWDTHNECEGRDPAFDAALRKVHPWIFEDR
jgi:hypothetical protein